MYKSNFLLSICKYRCTKDKKSKDDKNMDFFEIEKIFIKFLFFKIKALLHYNFTIFRHLHYILKVQQGFLGKEIYFFCSKFTK